MQSVYATTQPIPIPFVGDCLRQLEDQGWHHIYVLSVGVMRPKIATPSMPGEMPVFCIIAVREVIEGEEVVQPILKF
jgi:hypothetical protein